MAEFEYHQRPSTKEYRENWEKAFPKKKEKSETPTYPNGCPILNEGPKDA